MQNNLIKYYKIHMKYKIYYTRIVANIKLFCMYLVSLYVLFQE